MIISVTLLSEPERITSNPNKNLILTSWAAVLPKSISTHILLC